jgi:hypothetical protein
MTWVTLQIRGLLDARFQAERIKRPPCEARQSMHEGVAGREDVAGVGLLKATRVASRKAFQAII